MLAQAYQAGFEPNLGQIDVKQYVVKFTLELIHLKYIDDKI